MNNNIENFRGFRAIEKVASSIFPKKNARVHMEYAYSLGQSQIG